jgi:PiT family inorganic phosphate transporter
MLSCRNRGTEAAAAPTRHAGRRAVITGAPEPRLGRVGVTGVSNRRGKGGRAKAAGYQVLRNPRPAVTGYVAHHKINEGTYPPTGDIESMPTDHV